MVISLERKFLTTYDATTEAIDEAFSEDMNGNFPELTEEEYTTITTQPLHLEDPTGSALKIETEMLQHVQHENTWETNMDVECTNGSDTSQHQISTPHNCRHNLRPTPLFQNPTAATSEPVGNKETETA